MHRVAFRMKLRKGFEAEYKKRHDEIWPELASLLKMTGIENYTIFHDAETGFLFASYLISHPERTTELSNEPVMKKWWAHMKDIMDTHPDNSPVSYSLTELFFLK